MNSFDINKEEGFDMVFIDADKGGYEAYYEACLTVPGLLAEGGVIVVDNVLFKGQACRPRLPLTLTLTLTLSLSLTLSPRLPLTLALTLSLSLTLTLTLALACGTPSAVSDVRCAGGEAAAASSTVDAISTWLELGSGLGSGSGQG